MIRKQNQDWSGIAFAGKFALPTLLLVGSWIAAFPIHDKVTALLFLIIVVPMVSVAIFLLLVPGQLRTEKQVILFRRWLHWRTLPVESIEQIQRSVSVFGIIRLVGTHQTLLFFIEPENRHLLSFRRDANSDDARHDMSDRVTGRYGVESTISAGVGVATGFVWLRLAPHSVSNRNLPGPFEQIFEVETRHPYYVTIFVLVVLFLWMIKTRDRRTRSQSVLLFWLFGLMVSRIFILG
jgi:hypothetical protein